MNVTDLTNAINNRVDDELSGDTAVYEWLNAALNQLGIAVQAVFPQLTVATDIPVIPVKYHESLAVYAAAKYKERDSSLSEASNFMQQFENMKKDFIRYYDPPLQYRDDPLSQIFTATAGQMAYVITKDSFDPTYGDLQVFYNGRVLQRDVDYQQTRNPATSYANVVTTNTTTNDPNGFTLNAPLVVSAGDVISAIWEEHEDYVRPPYEWWSW